MFVVFYSCCPMQLVQFSKLCMRSFWLIAALVLFGVVEVWCYNNIAYAIGERRFGCSDYRWTLVWLCSNYNLEIIL